MGANVRIPFFVDENQPAVKIRRILAAHDVTLVQIQALDPEILRTADERAAVVITADKWFLKELFRIPPDQPGSFKRAGVIQVPGEWDKVQKRLTDYLPVIEAMYRLDRRVGIDLSQTEIRIKDPLSEA